MTKDKEKLQNQNVMQASRPCKLFAEFCVTFLGPMLSSLNVDLDDCSSLYLAVKPDVLGKLRPIPVSVQLLCPTEGDYQYQIREWGIRRKLICFYRVIHGFNRPEESKSRQTYFSVLSVLFLAIALFQAEWMDHLFYKEYCNLGVLYKLYLCSS